MSYYSTNYYGEDGSNNLINQKPTLLAPISFIKNEFEEENNIEIPNSQNNHTNKISDLKNTNIPTSNLNTHSPYTVESFNSNNENKSESTNTKKQEFIEKTSLNKNILNKSDSNNSKLESYKIMKHTNEDFSTFENQNIPSKDTLNNINLNSINENNLNANKLCNTLKNAENNSYYKCFNKICDPSFQLFPSTNSNWFGINIEKSTVSNIFFNDFEIDKNSNSIVSKQVPITANKFKYIAHTSLNCLCLQPKYNKEFKKFQPSYVMQIIKDLDFKHFYELKFWISKFDYNHFKAEGAANNTTYNLRISATLFLNDVSTSLCEFLEEPKNWPLTSNNTFLKFSFSPLFQILIPEGTPNEIILTGATKSPILSDYKFNFYNYIPNFNDDKFHAKNNDLIKANEATLVFIAEALDPNNPAGICFLDDICFS